MLDLKNAAVIPALLTWGDLTSHPGETAQEEAGRAKFSTFTGSP